MARIPEGEIPQILADRLDLDAGVAVDHELALPDRVLIATSDDAPETASELKFRTHATPPTPR
ncbi:MAG TPA: hypothetical protein VIW24_21875 [Aldersonia sp.]